VILVTCPCCKGEKMLQLFEEDQLTHTMVICCHCGAQGVVTAEIEDSVEANISKMNLWAKARQWLRT
jgi:Zn ribbon nucleic-acid-binding protein